MADTSQIITNIHSQSDLFRPHTITYSALTPNIKGYEQAISDGVRHIAIFASASQEFSKKNINCSIAESIERFRLIAERARNDGVSMRGYVSCVVGCPYEGRVEPEKVAEVSGLLRQLGCNEISLGDTIGVGTPGSVEAMISAVSAVVPFSELAIHCHDTYGQALANIHQSILVCLNYIKKKDQEIHV